MIYAIVHYIKDVINLTFKILKSTVLLFVGDIDHYLEIDIAIMVSIKKMCLSKNYFEHLMYVLNGSFVKKIKNVYTNKN